MTEIHLIILYSLQNVIVYRNYTHISPIYKWYEPARGDIALTLLIPGGVVEPRVWVVTRAVEVVSVLASVAEIYQVHIAEVVIVISIALLVSVQARVARSWCATLHVGIPVGTHNETEFIVVVEAISAAIT